MSTEIPKPGDVYEYWPTSDRCAYIFLVIDCTFVGNVSFADENYDLLDFLYLCKDCEARRWTCSTLDIRKIS